MVLREGGHRPCRAKMPAPMMAIPIDILLQRDEGTLRIREMGEAGRPCVKRHCRHADPHHPFPDVGEQEERLGGIPTSVLTKV